MNEKREVLHVLNKIMENKQLFGFLIGQYETDFERVRILQQILNHLGKEEQEELQREILEYGSRIREEDYIARQIFVWLYSFV